MANLELSWSVAYVVSPFDTVAEAKCEGGSLPMDALHINAIRAYGYTGALPEEQVLGQWFDVSLTLWLDLSVAGQSDRLSDTHDYSTTVPEIQTLIQTSRYQLIESLAEAIAQIVLKDDSLHQVRVQLVKLTPPIPNFSGNITVDITRSKGGRTSKN
ncbi:MAG: dihydroneopterin aldolase [Cyanobacteria bacterium P01_E01_bin.6]